MGMVIWLHDTTTYNGEGSPKVLPSITKSAYDVTSLIKNLMMPLSFWPLDCTINFAIAHHLKYFPIKQLYVHGLKLT